MRITPGMTAANALYNLQQGRAKLDKIQEQISSGLVRNRPSDDPIGTRQILDLENKIKEGAQYSSNIGKGNLWLSMTETALKGIADIIDQARKTAGAIPNGSDDSAIKENAISQLKELKNQLVTLGNSQLGDQYIFAGFSNDEPPFDTTENMVDPLTGAYLGGYSGGSGDKIRVEVDKNSSVPINLTGDEFLKPAGGIDVMATFDKLIAAIDGDNPADIQAGITEMKTAAKQVADSQAEVAGRMIRMQAAQNMVNLNQNTLKNLISNMQGIDYAKAGVELTQQQTAFQAALSTTSKIMNLSLLDYLK